MQRNGPNANARVFLGLGANLGDPVAQLRRAVGELSARRLLLAPLHKSSFYRTPPWGPVTDQPWFVNAAVRGQTSLAPLELLAALKALERELGRDPGALRWGPRPIDLDLLLYGRTVLTTPALTLPHPHIATRAFVLHPLLEIAPDLTDPISGKPYADFLPLLSGQSRTIEKLSAAW